MQQTSAALLVLREVSGVYGCSSISDGAYSLTACFDLYNNKQPCHQLCCAAYARKGG